MLEFFKRLFGTKTAESTPVPYKVEAPAKVSEFPFSSANPAKAEKKPAVKKPAVTAKTARKPRSPK